jgi:hypothetical protein
MVVAEFLTVMPNWALIMLLGAYYSGTVYFLFVLSRCVVSKKKISVKIYPVAIFLVPSWSAIAFMVYKLVVHSDGYVVLLFFPFLIGIGLNLISTCLIAVCLARLKSSKALTSVGHI